jgi:hypothetical protein
MGTHALASSDLRSASRLLIHAARDDGPAGWTIESLIRRLRAHLLEGPRKLRALPGLEICDLGGHQVLAIDDAGALVDVTLLPGTYHVSAEVDGVRRSYTVALEPGVSFDLYLGPAPDRH